jgi:RNA polymerase sigma-70 factor (ECF subfamily)
MIAIGAIGGVRSPGADVDEQGAKRRTPAGQGPGLARARLGDREAFADLYAGCAADVERLCRRMLGAPADAEEARHEVYVKAVQGFAGYDGARPFRTWLLAVAAHHCVDRLRRRSREQRLFEPLDEAEAPAHPAPSPLRAALDAEARARLQRALDGLPERYRAPLVMRHLGELSYDEIADLLAVSRGQVGVLLHRGRLRLRRVLEAPGSGAEETS